MKLSKIKIENFRGVKFAELLFPDHVSPINIYGID